MHTIFVPAWEGGALPGKKMGDNQHDGEIVGLHNPANGRSCNQHDCCGMCLQPGNLVRFKREVIQVVYGDANDPEPDYRYETVIKVVVIRDGTESCHVGFLP
jgi:hypothetical protein